MTDKTKLILALMTDSLKSKLFSRTKRQPSRVGFLCAPSPTSLITPHAFTQLLQRK